MADNISEFFVELGFKIDETERRKMVEGAKAAQRSVTANSDQEGQTRMSREAFRQKLAATGTNNLAKVRIEAERHVTGAVEKLRTDFAKKENERETDAAKKGRERRDTVFKEISKFALAFGAVASTTLAAVQGVATGVALAVGQAAKSFDNLNFASQRIGAAPQKISSFAYAVSQLGGSVEGANESLTNFGMKLKGPAGAGFESMLQGLGVRTRDAAGNLRDSAAIATDALQSLAKRPQAESMAFANALGFDDNTRRAGADPRFRGFEEQREREQAEVGFDPNKAAADATPVAQSMRRLEAIASDVGNKIKTDLFEKVKPLLDQLADWMAAHGADIAKVVGDIADKMLSFANTVSEKLAKTDFKAFFGDKGGTDGLIPALEATAAAALLVNTRFGGILSVLRLLTGMVLPGWLGWMAKAGAANAALAAPYVAQNGITSIDPATGQPFEANPMGSLGPRPGEEPYFQKLWRHRPRWMGGDGGGDDTHVSPSGPHSRRMGTNFTTENADAIVGAAKELGTTPEDLATVIGYETGGSFSPSKWGGAGGNYMGLIQFGPSEREQYGANQNQSFKEQMGAVVRYLKGRGFKPGMGLKDLYSTINAGSPGHYNASDGNGTVTTHVERMQGEMAAQARALLSLATPPAPPKSASDVQARDSRGNIVRTDAQGRSVGADGKPLTVLPAMPKNQFGSLDVNHFKTPALTMSPASLYASYDNSRTRGDTTVNAPTTFNIQGGDVKANLSTAKLFQAGRGTPDWITNLQGSER